MSWASKVRKVVCIGRNYADHAKELGNAAPKQPFFFLKPPSSMLLPGEGPILRPQGVKLHYELELAFVLGKKVSNADPATFTTADAIDAIDSYALALDLTARNVQDAAKAKGLPWSIPKGFDTFLPISNLIPKSKLTDPDQAHLKLEINGKVRQNDPTSLMMFKIPQIISTISTVMTLEPGDVILTGTPKGVGEIFPGDKLVGYLSSKPDGSNEIGRLEAEVAEKPGPYRFES